MRQIKDVNGNVLSEPYLTMANELFDAEYYERNLEEFPDCENWLSFIFGWYVSPQGYNFWETVDMGDKPATPQINYKTEKQAIKDRHKRELEAFELNYKIERKGEKNHVKNN